MAVEKDGNAKQADKSGPAWIAAITATAGMLAVLIVAILRFGRPRRTSLSRQGYASIPAHRAGGETITPTPRNFATPSTLAMTAGAAPPTVKSAPATALQGQTVPAAPDVTHPAPSPRWSLTTKYVVSVGLLLSILLMIYASRGSLSMIIFAALIAFVVRPLITWFQRRFKLKRGASTGITYLLVIVLLITVPLLIIPPIIDAVNYLLNIDYQAAVENLDAWLQTVIAQAQTMPIVWSIFGPLLESLSVTTQDVSTAQASTIVEPVTVTSLTNQFGRVMGILVDVVGPLVSAALSFIFMLLISLHMSLSSERLQKSYPRLIPEAYRPEILALVERIVNVWSSFLRGQLSLMLLMGFLTFILNWLLGTPYPLFLGFLAGLLEIIPSLGPVLATIPAVFFALFIGSTRFALDPLVFALIVIAGYVLLSALENQVLVPKVLGDAVSLPPLVVILGVVIFGALFGILGIFLATPVISTGKEIYAYLYDKILEPPQVEKPPEEKPGLLESIRSRLSNVRLPKLRRGKYDGSQPQAGTPENQVDQS